MTYLNPHAMHTALEKYAARAGINRIRQLLAQGEHNPAVQKELQALTSRAGDILVGRKNPQLGSQLRVLGSGGEGVAQHVLTPQGQRVLKVHDPSAAAFSPKVISNKDLLVGQDIPGFAQIHSRHTMPGTVKGQAVPAYMNEYVPGRTLTPEQFEGDAARKVIARGQEGVGRIELADLNRTNLKQTPSGEVKAIDYMPVAKSDMLPVGQRGQPNVLYENVDPASSTFKSLNFSNKKAPLPLQQHFPANAKPHQYEGELLHRAYNQTEPTAQFMTHPPPPMTDATRAIKPPTTQPDPATRPVATGALQHQQTVPMPANQQTIPALPRHKVACMRTLYWTR